MKILHVITTISRGGAENHLVDLCAGLRKRGLAVAVAYLKGDGYWTRELERMGISVTALHLDRYGQLAPAFALRRLMKTFQPDIVHAHLPPAELYARLALLGSRVPFIISKHNDEPFFRAAGHRQVAQWVAARSAAIIAISDAVKRFHDRYFTGSADRLITIHYGLDADGFRARRTRTRVQIRQELGIGEEAFVVGTVARLVPQKALEVMLRGFSQFRSAADPAAKLVIAGRGPLEGELRQMQHELGLGDSVVWLGFREDIADVMAAFDVFALSSNYEGFGLVLLEAMASGLPVAATRISAIPEIVAEGETGFLFKPQDPQGLSGILLKMRDAEARKRLGAAACKRAVTVFPLERMLERTHEIYVRYGM